MVKIAHIKDGIVINLSVALSSPESSDPDENGVTRVQADNARIDDQYINGKFVTPPPPPQTAEEVRAQREPLLAVADIRINQCEDNGLDAAAWRQYRQALRDVTVQVGFPEGVVWPVAPE